MSYRLETPRPRPPPIATPSQDKSPLLYDLPSATSATSPVSSKSRFSSAVSPSSARPRGNKRIKSPPPSANDTPSRALQSDLETFADQCRSWYYNQDDDAGRLMTQTLTTLPPSQRAPFARLQASIRSGYHASVSARRDAEYRAHLNSTVPGGSLTAHSRLDPNGSAAIKERYERFETFIHTWYTPGMPGTQPFFEALWAVMRLQVIPQKLGGADDRRVAWEIDDAVFKEAAGKDFMLEAIDVLKGVLAFEEVAALPSRLSSPSTSYVAAIAHSRAQSQPLFANSSKPSPLPKSPSISTTTYSKRPRAPSDPFLDVTTPPLSRSLATTSSISSSNPASDLVDDTNLHADDEVLVLESSHQDPFSEIDSQTHIWTSPNITNPEYLALLKLFPSSVSGRSLPRFPVSRLSERKPDIEEGEQESSEEMFSIRYGTGSIRLSAQERSDGWQGSWWTRFSMWWRTWFC